MRIWKFDWHKKLLCPIKPRFQQVGIDTWKTCVPWNLTLYTSNFHFTRSGGEWVCEAVGHLCLLPGGRVSNSQDIDRVHQHRHHMGHDGMYGTQTIKECACEKKSSRKITHILWSQLMYNCACPISNCNNFHQHICQSILIICVCCRLACC